MREITIPNRFGINTADAVVFGGGIVSAATAFWLSKAGITTILLEKRDALSSLTTPASAECFRTQFTEKPIADLALTSVEMFENFRDVVGLPNIDIHVTQRGYLFVTDDEVQLPNLKKPWTSSMPAASPVRNTSAQTICVSGFRFWRPKP